MKHFMLLAAMSLCLAVIMPTSAQAGKKRDARVAYVLKNLRLKADVQAKFKPVLEAYLKELSDLKDPYKKLKDELEDAINANKCYISDFVEVMPGDVVSVGSAF